MNHADLKGFFCVLEGINAAGKTSLVQQLAKIYRKQEKEFPFAGLVVTKEPSNGMIGREIRQKLRSGNQIEARQWLQLFMRDRWQHQVETVLPALRKNYLVLQDRYYYSSAAYQACASSSPKEIIELHQRSGYITPQLIFYLQSDPNISLQRQKLMNQPADIHENSLTLAKIHRNYQMIFKEVVKENVIRLRQSADVQQMGWDCFEILKEYIKLQYVH